MNKALGKPLPKLATISNNGKGVCWQERDKFLRTALSELASKIDNEAFWYGEEGATVEETKTRFRHWAKQARESAGEEATTDE